MPDINKASGVDYDILDAFKRVAQAAARATSENAKRLGVTSFEPSRGESAFLMNIGAFFLAHVEEGLGTKNLVADAMEEYNLPSLPGKYDWGIGKDCVAMIVNDMITVGALPVSIAMHLAFGDTKLLHERRLEGLIAGWKHGCDLAGCIWGPGETPELKGLVTPGTYVLSGSATGITIGKRWFNQDTIVPGDAIFFLGSSGVHSNGLTKARAIAEKLARGYMTPIGDTVTSSSYGDYLLTSTHIYVDAVEACLRRGIAVRYAVNITGHGWRKLMRAPQNLRYVVDKLPHPRPIFDFIQEYSHLAGPPLSDEDMYASYNMGAGFALYVAREDASRFLEVMAEKPHPYEIYEAGHVEAGERSVVIEPKGIEFKGDTLQIR